MTDLKTNEGLRILRNNYVGHLAFIAQNKPFTVPITYYFDSKDNSIISYSGNGHKIEAMRKNHFVSLQVDEVQSVHNWESVLVHGIFEELNGDDAKKKLHLFADGVKSIIHSKERKEVEFINEFSSKRYSGEHSIVYRINILEITGKRKET